MRQIALRLLAGLGVCCGLTGSAIGQTPGSLAARPVVHDVRVSVKIVTDANGRRPLAGHYTQDSQIQEAIQEANAALANMGAEWRLDLIEIVSAHGISEWFGPFDCTRKSVMEARAELNPSRFHWRRDAINVYIINDLFDCGGYCSYPAGGDDIIIINNSQGIVNWGLGWLHEIGHYFNLHHTFQCLPQPCQNNSHDCSGAGGPGRLCPDVCPDTHNIMGAADNLTPADGVFSPCQLQIIAAEMNLDAGRRRSVLSRTATTLFASEPTCPGVHPQGIPAGSPGEAAPTHGLLPEAQPIGAETGEVAPFNNLLGPATLLNNPFLSSDTTSQGVGEIGPVQASSTIHATAGAPAQPGGAPQDGAAEQACPTILQADSTPPRVMQIEAMPNTNSTAIGELIIDFSEPIDTGEIQSGFDFQVVSNQTPLAGTIRWENNDTRLIWTPVAGLGEGEYTIWLAGEDSTDFTDTSGNVLAGNGPSFFGASFAVSQEGRIDALPPDPLCGLGLPPMLAVLCLGLLTGARRRRRSTNAK